MNDYEPTEPKGIDLPSDAFRVGVDTAGREHWYSTHEHHVWVVRDGRVVHERDLRSIVDWVTFIYDDECGWDQRQPVEETNGLRRLVEDVCEEVA